MSRAARPELVVVHSSDLHVDDGPAARREIGADGTAWLSAVMCAAGAAAADLVLLAGDVFEHNRLPAALLDRAARILADAAVPVVVLPGNHDPLVRDSVYHRGGFAALGTVHILGHTHEDSVLLEELDLEVRGRAHRSYDDMAPLAPAPPRRTRWRIAMAHGHYQKAPDRSARPRPAWLLGDADIAGTDADYVALGHWNVAAAVGDGRVPAHYSGAPATAGTVNLVRLRDDGSVAVTAAACTPAAAHMSHRT